MKWSKILFNSKRDSIISTNWFFSKSFKWPQYYQECNYVLWILQLSSFSFITLYSNLSFQIILINNHNNSLVCSLNYCYQIRHLCCGFIGVLAGQLKADAKAGLFDKGPRTLNLSGACSSLRIWWVECLSVCRAHQGRA